MSMFICTQYRLHTIVFSSKNLEVFIWSFECYDVILCLICLNFFSCHTCSCQVNNFVVFDGFFQSRSGKPWLHHCSVVMWVWNVALDLCQCSVACSLRATTSPSLHYSICKAALYWNSSPFYSFLFLVFLQVIQPEPLDVHSPFKLCSMDHFKFRYLFITFLGLGFFSINFLLLHLTVVSKYQP